MTHKRGLLAVADLHCGSRFGLWPWVVSGGGRQSDALRRAQMYLLRKWEDMVEKVPELDVLLFNGDIVHGRNKAGVGRELITADVEEQCAAFLEVTEPLRAKSKTIIMTEGSRYHVEPELMEMTARAAGAIEGPQGKHSQPVADFEIDGVVVCAWHAAIGGAHIYLEQGLGKQINSALMYAREATGKVPDIIIGSHRHRSLLVQRDNITALLTPGWELQNKYAQLRQPLRWVPELGGALVVIEPMAKKVGVKPAYVRWLDYPVPKRKPMVIEVE